MDVQALANLIGSVGFPIAMCIYMVIFFQKALQELKDAVQNNTGVNRELSIYINELREELKHERGN